MSFDLSILPQPLAQLVQLQLKQLRFYNGTTKGLPGKNTQAAYDAYVASLTKRETAVASASNAEMREFFVEALRSMIGVREVGGNNRGPEVQKFQDAASWLPGTGWAWCAAFVGWGFDRLAEKFKLSFATPEGAGAFWYEDWAKQQGVKVLTSAAKIRRGDLVIYSYSHIDVATTDEDANGRFKTVGGNTNDAGSRDGDGVFEKWKTKKTAAVRSIIRPFP